MKKKFKVIPSAGKVMATIFWDSSDVILIEYVECGHVVTLVHYCVTFTKLHDAIHPGMLSNDVILLHYNARLHISTKLKNYCKSLIGKSGTTPVQPRFGP